MKKFIQFFSLALVVSTSANCAEVPVKKEATAKSKHDTYEMLNLFGEVFEKVKDSYVEPKTDEELIENSLNGMLSSLDPHSSYLNEKAFKDMQVQTKGEFGGLGIEVTMDNGLVKVVSPIDDTPAFKAGVKSGDYISHINDEPVMGITLSDAVDKMRGAVGSKVKLTILREGLNEPLDLTMTRDVIKIKVVKAKMIGDDIVYLRLASFSEQAAKLLQDNIEQFQKKQGGKIKGYVLDLRNNPGGLLDQAIDVSDIFLTQGEIVSTRGRDAEGAKRYNATKGDLTNGAPLVVLINGGSASASEIVSGALQDHKRAIVMGTKSFGKGSVQTIIPLTGHGAMRITTSRYYTPSGRSIQAEGIVPDIEVKQGEIKYSEPNKFMRNEASLTGHLANPDEKKTEDKPAPEVKSTIAPMMEKLAKEADKKAAKGSAEETPADEDDAKDLQLGRAVDLIRGLSVVKNAQAN